MSIRAQTIECRIYGKDIANKKRSKYGITGTISVFKHKFNRTMEVSATEFLVIHDIMLSDKMVIIKKGEYDSIRDYEGYVQLRIDDRRVFTDIKGDDVLGIPHDMLCTMTGYPVFDDLPWEIPLIEVPPGSSFEFIVTCSTPMKVSEEIYFKATTTLYDNVDAVIANQLKELHVVITPDNIAWYKKKLAKKDLEENKDGEVEK